MKLKLLYMAISLLFAGNLQAFYNPELGRWVNRDPIGEKGGMNLFSFILNDPVGSFDAYGLMSKNCKKTCEQAMQDKTINNGSRNGMVVCAADGEACPCPLAYSGNTDKKIGDCPEIDKVIESHEQYHIEQGTSFCDLNKHKIHPAGTCATKEEQHKQECENRKKHQKALEDAARLSRGACKSIANLMSKENDLYIKLICK